MNTNQNDIGLQMMAKLLEQMPSESVTFLDMQGNKETFEIKPLFMKSMSDFDFQKSIINVPLSSSKVKVFIETLQKGTINYNKDNIIDYYKLASYFKMKLTQKLILGEFDKLLPEDAINISKSFTKNSFTNIQDFNEINNRINDVLISQVYKLDHDMFIHVINMDQLNFLLSSNNFQCKYPGHDLEGHLLKLLTLWYNHHKTDVENSKQEFLTSWKLLHHSCISIISYEFFFNTSLHYKNKEICAEISPIILSNIFDMFNNKEGGKQRYQLKKMVDYTVNGKFLTSEQIKEIKVGDVFDVCDKFGNWYMGNIANVTDENVKVSFQGWGHTSDEIISKTEKLRFAEKGSITNNVPHSLNCIGQNKCIACKHKILIPPLDSLITMYPPKAKLFTSKIPNIQNMMMNSNLTTMSTMSPISVSTSLQTVPMEESIILSDDVITEAAEKMKMFGIDMDQESFKNLMQTGMGFLKNMPNIQFDNTKNL
jgi:hypothetical protein